MTRDEFPYGYRQITTYDHTGQPSYEYFPLQPDDFLNPGADDHFDHGPRHEQDVADLYSIFQRIYSGSPFVTVLRNQQFAWPTDRGHRPVPDLAIVPDMLQPYERRDIFDVERENTSPRCIIEVLSPRFADLDLVQKKELYQQAGVAEYIMIDSGLRDRREAIHYQVLAYRMHDGLYQPVEPDGQDRIYSPSNEVWIGPNDSHDGFLVIDARTGHPIAPAEIDVRVTIEEIQGSQRARSLESALDFLRSG